MTAYVRLHPDDREAIAKRVAELMRGEREPAPTAAPPDHVELLTARAVAERFGVSREWVYEHKAELGAILLGDGPRPRLRFDPARVSMMLHAANVAVPRADPPVARARTRRHGVPPGGAELLPIRGRQA